MKNIINIELTNSESIVLLELLSRINQENRTELFKDQSEERVLWDLESMLESKLNEPFKKNYSELLENARNEVRDKF